MQFNLQSRLGALAREFLASPAFDKFTVDYFVNDILNVIEQEFEYQ